MQSNVKMNDKYIDLSDQKNCLRAAQMALDLQSKVKKLEEICARPEYSGQSLPCTEIHQELQDIIDQVQSHAAECACGGTCTAGRLCPMASAPIAVSGIGVSLAALKLQASAMHLYQVAN